MKKLLICLFLCLALTGYALEISEDAQKKLDAIDSEVNEFLQQNPQVQEFLQKHTSVSKGISERLSSLPAYETDEEKALSKSIRFISKSVRNREKPSGNYRAPAEYEKAEALFLGWPGSGHDRLQAEIAAAVADKYKVYIVTRRESGVKRALNSAGANMSNIEFISAPLNALWIRDYGPWFIYTEDGDREIIDLKYYWNRPDDNALNRRLGAMFNFKVYDSQFQTEGGNIILDGHGVAVMGDVLTHTYSKSQVKQIMRDYFGCDKTIILKSLKKAGGTGHIDIFAKLLSDTTMLVGQHSGPSGGYSGNYDLMEEHASILAGETNGKGQRFNVVRLPMPDHRLSTYTYTNSLIMNDKVLVPIYDIGRKKSEKPVAKGFVLAEDENENSRGWNDGINDRALQVYRDCLPGYDVYGIDCSDIIHLGGCIHCITKMLMADPMKIMIPEAKAVRSIREGDAIPVQIQVEGRHGILDETVCVNWSLEEHGIYKSVQLSGSEGMYQGYLPPQAAGTTVYYYFTAEDVSGMYETLPEDAVDGEKFSLYIGE